MREMPNPGEPANVLANIAASQTASAIVAAVTTPVNRRIRVVAFVVMAGGTATNVTFNSGSSAISCLFACGANGGISAPYNPNGWFTTNPGEALTVTTGAGSTTGIQVSYTLLP